MERRSFLQGTSLLGAGMALGLHQWALAANKLRYQIGFAAIAWNGNDLQALKDIASLGYHGIQLRGNTYKAYGADLAKTNELIQILKDTGIQVPVFSGGNLDIDKPKEPQLAFHQKQVAFAKAIGVKYYQFTNNSRPKDGSVPTTDSLDQYAKLLAEGGEVIHAAGLVPVYHNHMHQLGETAMEVDQIMKGLKGSRVKLLLDVAHFTQGGGDPVAAIKTYHKELAVLHLKDVANDPDAKNGYKFVELGQGRVNLKGIFEVLNKIKFDGWGIIELDAIPVVGRTPLESATISHHYLQQTLGL